MNKSTKKRLLALSLTTAITLATNSAFGANEEKVTFGSQIVDAAEFGNNELVEQLLTRGINPNESGEFGATPLMRAAYHDNAQLVNILLKNGASPNMADMGGATALHIAAREGHNDIVQLLIKAGANVNLADREGFTPLMRSTLTGNVPVTKELIAAGAKVDAVNKFGETPIYQATKDNRQEVARLLAENGAKAENATAKVKVTEVASDIPDPVDDEAEPATQTAQEIDRPSDISVDFSNGKLAASRFAEVYKPAPVKLAKNKNSEADYYASSLDIPGPIDKNEFIHLPKKPLPADADSKDEIKELAVIKEALAEPSAGKPPTDKLVEKPADKLSDNDIAYIAPAAPAISAEPYEIAAEQMVYKEGGRHSAIDLGSFKNEEFANKKIEQLKRDFSDLFSNLSLKVVRTGKDNNVYQVQADVSNAGKISEICKRLISAGTNCRPAESAAAAPASSPSQEVASQTVPQPERRSPMEQPAAKTTSGNDLLGPVPPPPVESKELPRQVAMETEPPASAALPQTVTVPPPPPPPPAEMTNNLLPSGPTVTVTSAATKAPESAAAKPAAKPPVITSVAPQLAPIHKSSPPETAQAEDNLPAPEVNKAAPKPAAKIPATAPAKLAAAPQKMEFASNVSENLPVPVKDKPAPGAKETAALNSLPPAPPQEEPKPIQIAAASEQNPPAPMANVSTSEASSVAMPQKPAEPAEDSGWFSNVWSKVTSSVAPSSAAPETPRRLPEQNPQAVLMSENEAPKKMDADVAKQDLSAPIVSSQELDKIPKPEIPVASSQEPNMIAPPLPVEAPNLMPIGPTVTVTSAETKTTAAPKAVEASEPVAVAQNMRRRPAENPETPVASDYYENLKKIELVEGKTPAAAQEKMPEQMSEQVASAEPAKEVPMPELPKASDKEIKPKIKQVEKIPAPAEEIKIAEAKEAAPPPAKKMEEEKPSFIAAAETEKTSPPKVKKKESKKSKAKEEVVALQSPVTPAPEKSEAKPEAKPELAEAEPPAPPPPSPTIVVSKKAKTKKAEPTPAEEEFETANVEPLPPLEIQTPPALKPESKPAAPPPPPAIKEKKSENQAAAELPPMPPEPPKSEVMAAPAPVLPVAPKKAQKEEVIALASPMETAESAKAPEIPSAPEPKAAVAPAPAPAPAALGEPPRDMVSGSYIQNGQIISDRFQVARPIKVSEGNQNSLIATNWSNPVQDISPYGSEIWIKVDFFKDRATARNFWNDLRNHHPALANYRMRTTNPPNDTLQISAEIGPFVSIAEADKLCTSVIPQELTCTAQGAVSSISSSNALRYAAAEPIPALDTYAPASGNTAAAESGNWAIQLGSYSSHEDAASRWKYYSTKSRELKKLQSNIITSTDGKFRLRAGNFASTEKAESLCQKLRAKSISCIMVHD